MDLTDEQIATRLGAIKSLPTCTQWATGFAESIIEQSSKGRMLSDRQKVICYKILKENNEEAQQSLANWETEYKTKHEKQAKQIASYYSAQAAGYFGDVVKVVLADEVPPRAKYLKMRNNKYAKKVLSELERKPRFGTEDHIVPNSKFLTGYSYNSSMMETREGQQPLLDVRESFKRRGGIILGVDNKIKSAARGAERYLVLPFGSAETYWCEERYLKVKPKVKKVKK